MTVSEPVILQYIYFGLFSTLIRTVHIGFIATHLLSHVVPTTDEAFTLSCIKLFYFLLISVHVLCYCPFCYKCFRLVVIFKSVGTRILLHYWKQVVVAWQSIPDTLTVIAGLFNFIPCKRSFWLILVNYTLLFEFITLSSVRNLGKSLVIKLRGQWISYSSLACRWNILCWFKFCGFLSVSLSGTIFETVSRSNGCVVVLLYSRPLGRFKKIEFNWSLLMLLNVTGNTKCL
jgi:hypothetical protein